ncbi:MAG: MBL fold metallo-hydrolase [Limnochordales bacterium]
MSGALLLVALAAALAAGPAAAGQAGAELVVFFLDVGQGDATLLQGPDFTILIDAGRHDRADVVPYLEAAGVKAIDLFIGTHAHSDHIGQCAAVMGRFPVKEVWLPGHVHTSLTFERCLDAILDSDAGYHEPRAGEAFQVGSARVEVVHPASATGDLNNDSIAVRILYGDVVLLFTGDAEAPAEAAMVERGLPLSAHVLHMGHHGSRTSSTAPFLAAVAPEVAIYSAGAGNSYGHPHPEALARVAAAGAMVYGTDVHGTVRVTTDGRRYTVVPERGEPAAGPRSRGPVAESAMPAAPAHWASEGDEPAAPGGPGLCGPGQVDINSAPAAELTRIVHIGPALAERVIALRPFASVADLLRVPGIGPARLAAIEDQGLACAAALSPTAD